jgi:hypothetical protein
MSSRRTKDSAVLAATAGTSRYRDAASSRWPDISKTRVPSAPRAICHVRADVRYHLTCVVRTCSTSGCSSAPPSQPAAILEPEEIEQSSHAYSTWGCGAPSFGISTGRALNRTRWAPRGDLDARERPNRERTHDLTRSDRHRPHGLDRASRGPSRPALPSTQRFQAGPERPTIRGIGPPDRSPVGEGRGLARTFDCMACAIDQQRPPSTLVATFETSSGLLVTDPWRWSCGMTTCAAMLRERLRAT